MTSIVDVRNLTKCYTVPVRDAGLRASLTSIFKRETRQVEAVRDISFGVSAGEIVGFLGPNGAGKTTTLKMLAGLLHPTRGEATVLGHEPWRRQRSYLEQITLVMGQRNQLIWDIPVIDSFERNRAIYGIEWLAYRQRLSELTDLLALENLLRKPVRNLSLGERMKCEVAAALLHAPRLLFLDEPTIGLDVSMQRRLRQFIRDYNARSGATVLLTSHYMADISALCRRVIVLHRGGLLFDGDLNTIVQRFATHKTITISATNLNGAVASLGAISQNGSRMVLRIKKEDAPRITSELLSMFDIHDLTVEDPPIEEVIDDIFRGKESEGLFKVSEA